MRLLAATFAVLPLLLTATAASAGWLCGSCKPQHCCPPVRYACCPKYELVKIEKSCFDIEPEAICVPKVKLPWQSCRTPRCARVIVVNRLTSRSYECGERCVLVWEAKPICRQCGKPHTASPPAPSEPSPPPEPPAAAPVSEPQLPAVEPAAPATPDAAMDFPSRDIFGAALK